MSTIEVSPYFGLVVLTVFMSIVVHNVYMSLKVSQARKKYGVKYPNLYAPPDHKDADLFNCIQRGHQNSLESWPAHIVMTILIGLKFPVFAAISAVLYNLGRLQYFHGYSTGEPKKRTSRLQLIGILSELVGVAVVGVLLLLKR